MLDTFLKVAYDRTKETEDQARLVTSMRALPEEYLHKLASGEEKLAFFSDGTGCWLEKFKGTPLLEQAIELEKQELQIQMAEKARWREEDQRRSESNVARDELCIQKKLLDLQLAEAEGGVGQEEPMPEGMPEEEPPMEEEVPEEEVEEEPPVEEEAPPAPPQEGGGEDSKPKVDVKVAAARMRFAMKKEALGLGMLAKTLGAAGKSVGGAGMQAAKSARGFGAGNMDAAKMGLGAMKGQAGKVMPTVARAGQSYVKSNPMQAAGLAAGAGLGTGLAMG